jgi:transcriptional regulator with XRE-family HTH domain
MDLRDYLQSNGMTALAFSRRIDTSHVAVGRWLNKQRIPNAVMMRRIIQATNGAVTPNDFYVNVLPRHE